MVPGLLSRSGTRRRLSAQNMETYKYHKYTIGPTRAPPIPPTPPRTGRGHGPRLHNMNNTLQTCRPEVSTIFREFKPSLYGHSLSPILLAFSIKTLCQTGVFDVSTTADLTLLQLECVLTFLWWYYWNAAPGPHHTFPAWQSHWNPFSSNRKICREF